MVWWAGALAQNMLRPLPNGQAQTGEQSPRLGGEFMWLLGTTVLVLGHAEIPHLCSISQLHLAPSPHSPEMMGNSASGILCQVRPWGVVAQCCAAGLAPLDTRHLSMLVTTAMPLVPAPEVSFALTSLTCLLPLLPQMRPARVLQGPPSHQHHHHLPQRGPLHPAQDHPQVSQPSWSQHLVRACLLAGGSASCKNIRHS